MLNPPARALASVRPAAQICGSVKIACEAPPSSALSRSSSRSSGRPLTRAAITSAQILAWYLPV
jgi:hypothetical protein